MFGHNAPTIITFPIKRKEPLNEEQAATAVPPAPPPFVVPERLRYETNSYGCWV